MSGVGIPILLDIPTILRGIPLHYSTSTTLLHSTIIYHQPHIGKRWAQYLYESHQSLKNGTRCLSRLPWIGVHSINLSIYQMMYKTRKLGITHNFVSD